MNKGDLRSVISGRYNTTLDRADRVIEAVISSIKEALFDGDMVSIKNFGSFRVRHYGQFPTVVFKASKKLKKTLRQKEI
jgi:nucleoid DNA-binding protein